MKKLINKKKGFTLIELLVVIAIIAILAAVIAPNAFKAIEKSKVSAAISDYKALKTSTLSYYSDTGTWPVNDMDDVGFVTAPTTTTTPAVTATVQTAWNGPYLEKWPDKNPWGGTYTFVNSAAAAANPYGNVGQRYVEMTLVPDAAATKLIADLGSDIVKKDTTTVRILISKD